jgi:hypothetical protein
MKPLVKWFASIASLVALALSAFGQPDSQPGSDNRFRVASTPGGPPQSSRAGFYTPPAYQQWYSANSQSPYGGDGGGYWGGGYLNPYGGYVSGEANVISSWGGYLIDVQQSRVAHQQVEQAKIDTRRKAFDEWLYERALTPTTEDERERARIENLRRSYNDPPITEIWSGKALNDILAALQKMTAQQGPGPTILLNQGALDSINVTAGGSTGNLGPLRNGGKLNWPLALRGSAFNTARKSVDQLAPQAYQQASAGSVDGDTLQQLSKSVDSLESELVRHVADISPNDYIRAKRYLNELDQTVQALQDPKVSNYVTHKWAARGSTVSELVADMSSQGLKFAPATAGDEAAYNSLYRSLVSALPPPVKPQEPYPR